MSNSIYIYNDDKKPIFVMMVGLPGSGKSYYAERIECDNGKPVIHSSDKLREELFGDVNEQGKNDVLFNELHRRIKDDLIRGKDVVYDATNISKKRRIAFLKELKNINCFKACVCIATQYKTCLALNNNRERKVPESVIDRMYKQFCPPHKHEGFDYITIVNNRIEGEDECTLEKIEKMMVGFDQENEHHKLDLWGHSLCAKKYISNYPFDDPERKRLLEIAAIFHDCGKLNTKSRLNSRGVFDGNYHYYNHDNVGAYDFLASVSFEQMFEENIIYISNLIYFHMMPYLSWKQSKRAREKWRNIIGKDMFDDVYILHEADLNAH